MGISLTVFGEGQCRFSRHGAFHKVHNVAAGENGGEPVSEFEPVIIAGAGCKMGDIIRKTMTVDLTVPLESRPSLGAGLWLQGGIGHLAKMHGLSCDAIVGAVVVSVNSGQVFCIGCVPNQHKPASATRPENETDL